MESLSEAAGTQPQAEGSQSAAEERPENQDQDESDVLIAKAHSLIDKMTANTDNPSPSVLHALSTLLEAQEARYLKDSTDSSTSHGRSSHDVGRLGILIRENEEFFKLISSTFLTATRYSISVRAASVRLLVACSPTWMYPVIFDDDVLANIRAWVMEEMLLSSNDERNSSHNTKQSKAADCEMLLTYSTGLLAVSLASFDQLAEDILTPGLSAKLMQYLRLRILGDTSLHQKDGNQSNDIKNAHIGCQKAKDEAKSRLRQTSESSSTDVRDPSKLDSHDGDRARSLTTEPGIDDDIPDGEAFQVDTCGQFRVNVGEKGNFKESLDLKVKSGVKNIQEEEFDENARRRPVRVISRSRGKLKPNDVGLDSELPSATSSSSRTGLVQTVIDKDATGNLDLQRVSNSNVQGASNHDFSLSERDENDDCFQGCKVGSKDFSDLVKMAVRAAEAEARAANASAEAIKVAGDDVAEMVKSAAFEEYLKLNDEDAAVAAASTAATAVINAADAVALSRNSINADGDSGNATPTEREIDEDTEFVIPDSCTLGKLREKFCIQCLGPLGGYVDVLGPVLHEKGVDVCLSLLLRSSKDSEQLNSVLLPDILKLICALTAHKKFAALFIDRGGIQRLLSVPRTSETFFGLSSCLHALGSSQGIMERVCALSSDVIQQFVELALQLLDCQDHAARKNASSFFAVVFVFRAVIDAFDGQEGLLKLLSLLHEAALVRSGVAPGPSNNRASLRNDQSPAEVLTSSEKQIAYHTCVALCHYFRAHLLLLLDTIRPSKNVRNAPRNMSRVACKPLDISNEAMNAIFRQIQKDRKLGPALVRARWVVVEKFLASNGHITILELCQAPLGEGHLHDLLEYALGVLQIVTLVPCSRKPIVNATLSNDRVGIAVILDLANGAGYVKPEVVVPALNVLINLVCPPPSISNKPSNIIQNQQPAAAHSGNVSVTESRGVPAHFLNNHSQSEPRERTGDPSADRAGLSLSSSTFGSISSQAIAGTLASGLVGDRRISLGAGAGCAGLAAQIEQGYRQARDAVRANNGIKVLLQLLQPRMVTSPAALDCIRALTCRVLLGLARDDTIAHILTKLQVGKKLSELIRDSGYQTSGGEQNRWQSELAQVTLELIGVVTNSGRASTLVASDAATPTLRRIERASIAAATPISYHSWELLLLIHEHLQALGLADSAATLLKEANLTPLPSLSAPSSLMHQSSGVETSAIQIHWPSGRAASGFLVDKPKGTCNSDLVSSRKKCLAASASAGRSKVQLKLEESPLPSSSLKNAIAQDVTLSGDAKGPLSVCPAKPSADVNLQFRTPIVLPRKRKADMKDGGSPSPAKRPAAGDHVVKSTLFGTPNSVCKSSFQTDSKVLLPSASMKDQANRPVSATLASSSDGNQLAGQNPLSQQGPINDQQHCGSERLTLDSLVVQYLKYQHRQCPVPITTLPPLSLLHPHVCPEPRRSLDAPSNVTSRLSTREFRSMYGSIHGRRKDRQFVYSRFRPWRTCRDDAATMLTCIAFLEDSSRIAVGGQNGELKVFETDNNNLLESCIGHQSPVTFLQSHYSGETRLLLSSSAVDVLLWDASSVSGGPKHTFDGIKAARLNNSGSMFAALRPDLHSREILLYDVHTCQLDLTLTDTSNNFSGRGNSYSLIHFNQDSSRVLWNGVLWDYREPNPIHRFDKFTDYGGGGFHPAGNEVIINSEVWDLRTFRLLRSVPSLDQTVITFNASGDVIYAILRRNFEDVHSVLQPRRMKHPLYSAFRTVDAVNYSDIATIPVDRCVLDFATEPTDSFVGLINVDDQDDVCSFARVFEIGRRKPTDDDSDPDDAESEDDEEEEEEDDDSFLDADIDEDVDSDGDELGDDEDDDDDGGVSDFDDEEDDGDFMMDDDVEFDGGGILEILAQGVDEDEDSDDVVESYSSGDEDGLL